MYLPTFNTANRQQTWNSPRDLSHPQNYGVTVLPRLGVTMLPGLPPALVGVVLGKVLAEKCCSVRARPLTKLSHHVDCAVECHLQRTVIYGFGGINYNMKASVAVNIKQKLDCLCCRFIISTSWYFQKSCAHTLSWL